MNKAFSKTGIVTLLLVIFIGASSFAMASYAGNTTGNDSLNHTTRTSVMQNALTE